MQFIINNSSYKVPNKLILPDDRGYTCYKKIILPDNDDREYTCYKKNSKLLRTCAQARDISRALAILIEAEISKLFHKICEKKFLTDLKDSM